MDVKIGGSLVGGCLVGGCRVGERRGTVIEGSRVFIKSTPSHTSNKELGEFGWTILNLIGSGKGENISNFTTDSMPIARALGVMVRHASAAGRLTSR